MRKNIMLSSISALLISGLALSKSETKTPETMTRLLESMEIIIPLSLSADNFQAKKNRKIIEQELRKLAANTTALNRHFRKLKTKEYSFIAASIAKDALDAYQLYQNKSFYQSRFIVHNISENCVTCHSKVPAGGKKLNPGTFFGKSNRNGLAGYELAHFEVMSRQFDQALSLYEKEFLTKNTIDENIFSNYLKVAYRVNVDAKRVVKLLVAMSKKPNQNSYQRSNISAWLEQAKRIEKSGALKNLTMLNVRQLLGDSLNRSSVIMDRYTVVNKVAASAVLHRVLNSANFNKIKRSEIYYLLGVAEISFSKSFWVSEVENYLEHSINLAPREAWSKNAFRLLKSQYLFGYTGSGGVSLPEDVKALLSKLQKKVGKPSPTNG